MVWIVLDEEAFAEGAGVRAVVVVLLDADADE